jgi:formylglycine-generating enzyme required for sulfatase activity
VWYSSNAGSKTHEVGKKQPNELGLYDMSGNVWEWTYDWSAGYPSGAKTDYTGAASGSNRVNCGGGWNHGASYCKVAGRYDHIPHDRYIGLGFRVVCP